MDYQMSDDDPEGSAAMNNHQQSAGRCPARSSVDSTSASSSSQSNWRSGAQYGGPHMAHSSMGAFYPQSGAPPYWTQPGQQGSHPVRHPYVSHQPRSEYGNQENSSHGQAQIHNHSRAHHMEDGRQAMPRAGFTNSDHATAAGGMSGQGGHLYPGSLTSSPSQNPASIAWSMQGYAIDGSGRPATGYPQFQSLPRPPISVFGGSTSFGHAHPRQLPQLNFAGSPYSPGLAQPGHLSMPQSSSTQRGAPNYMGNASVHISSQGTQRRAPAVAAPYEDSDDDSEPEEDEDDEDDDAEASLFRVAAQGVPRRRRPEAVYGAPTDAELLRERQRAARRAQLHNVKSIASPEYIATLKKVDPRTLEGDDLMCMICYNEFGVENPEGQIEFAVRLEKCKHILGMNCLKKWFEDSDSCPYCRDKVPSIYKSKVRMSRHAHDDPGRPVSAIYNRYHQMTPEERLALVSQYAAEQHRGYFGGHGDRDMARSRGGLEHRSYMPADLDALLPDLRDGTERLESLLYPQGIPAEEERYYRSQPEYRDRHERMMMQRLDADMPHLGAPVYGTRSVPQSERRRQARVRAASNRGMNHSHSGSVSISGTPAPPGLRLPAMNDSSPEPSRQAAAHRTHHSATSSLDSNSSGSGDTSGQRSITPHPAMLDLSGAAMAIPPLNPQAPPWNGMSAAQPQLGAFAGVHGLQPPDSEGTALFGYYSAQTGMSRGGEAWGYNSNNNRAGAGAGGGAETAASPQSPWQAGAVMATGHEADAYHAGSAEASGSQAGVGNGNGNGNAEYVDGAQQAEMEMEMGMGMDVEMGDAGF